MSKVVSRSNVIGLKVYTSNARFVGTVKDLGFDVENPSNLHLVIELRDGSVKDIPITAVAVIGDIILLKESAEVPEPARKEALPVKPAATTQPTPTKPAAPVQKPPTPAPTAYVIPRCSSCGAALIYYPQYRKWYCPKCKKYVEVTPQVLAGAPRCPTCNNHLSYVERYGKWYCYHCNKYVDIRT